MKVFVSVGSAIILGLLLIAVHAEHCRECCNGQPCNPKLAKQETDHD